MKRIWMSTLNTSSTPKQAQGVSPFSGFSENRKETGEVKVRLKGTYLIDRIMYPWSFNHLHIRFLSAFEVFVYYKSEISIMRIC